MKHFSHPHDLQVEMLPPENEYETRICFGCRLPLFETCYTCSWCNFHLHKVCFDLPQQAHLKSHPHHASTLLYPPYCQGQCHECGEYCVGFTYNCAYCNHNQHATCSMLDLKPRLDHDAVGQCVTLLAKTVKRKDAGINSLRNELGAVKGELASVKSELASVRGELAAVKASGRHRREDDVDAKRMEREAELQRMKNQMYMQQIQAMSDSCDRMNQII